MNKDLKEIILILTIAFIVITGVTAIGAHLFHILLINIL